MQEKIRTSSRIPTEQVEKIVRVSIEYAEATRRGPTPAQVWQKLESIESLAKEQSQHHDSINDKLTVLKEQRAAISTPPKPQTWAAAASGASGAQPRPPLYNKQNEIVVKLNDSASAEEMRKQAPEEVAHRIDAYLMENNITTTKLRAARTLPSGDVAIQTTSIDEAEKLREEDGWTKVLGSKAKLTRKRYGVVALGIPVAKMDFEKMEETKEKLVTQNASMCTGMKIESLFWLSSIKKDRQTASLVVEVDDAKMANLLIEEGLVLDHTLHGCMRYNPACKVKQCFKCYEYGHVSVHCRKNTRCGACSGPHRTSECPRDKEQKCPLCNGAHTSWDKKCEYRKREYLRIEAAKQSTPRLYDISSKPSRQREEPLGAMRPPPKPQQRPPPENGRSQQQSPQETPVPGKRGRSASDGRPPLQTTSGNGSRFTAAAKVQVFERPTTRSQNQNCTDEESL